MFVLTCVRHRRIFLFIEVLGFAIGLQAGGRRRWALLAESGGGGGADAGAAAPR